MAGDYVAEPSVLVGRTDKAYLLRESIDCRDVSLLLDPANGAQWHSVDDMKGARMFERKLLASRLGQWFDYAR